jgi:hypothetical protein
LKKKNKNEIGPILLSPARSLTFAQWPAGDRSFGQQTDPTIIIDTTPRLRFASKHPGSSSSD